MQRLFKEVKDDSLGWKRRMEEEEKGGARGVKPLEFGTSLLLQHKPGLTDYYKWLLQKEGRVHGFS